LKFYPVIDAKYFVFSRNLANIKQKKKKRKYPKLGVFSLYGEIKLHRHRDFNVNVNCRIAAKLQLFITEKKVKSFNGRLLKLYYLITTCIYI